MIAPMPTSFTQESGCWPVAPLPPHYESRHAFSTSVLGSVKNGDTLSVVSQTMTFLHINERVIVLQVIGDKNDLDWTRTQSKTWADSIIAANE